MLYPLEQGKCCAIGWFGEDRRTWCAIITADGNSKQANVFHEATHITSSNSLDQSGDDPHLVFSPSWIHEYRGMPGSPPTLLVGRCPFHRKRHPLAINLETLDVSVFPQELYMADRCHSNSYLNRNDEILEACEFYVTHWAAPGKKWPDGKEWRHLCTNVTNAGLLCGVLLPYDGWIYVPGSCWYRMNPVTLAEEMLVPGRLPLKYSMGKYTVSSHYGLVAFGQTGNGGNNYFYQVTIRDNPVTPSQ